MPQTRSGAKRNRESIKDHFVVVAGGESGGEEDEDLEDDDESEFESDDEDEEAKPKAKGKGRRRKGKTRRNSLCRACGLNCRSRIARNDHESENAKCLLKFKTDLQLLPVSREPHIRIVIEYWKSKWKSQKRFVESLADGTEEKAKAKERLKKMFSTPVIPLFNYKCGIDGCTVIIRRERDHAEHIEESHSHDDASRPSCRSLKEHVNQMRQREKAKEKQMRERLEKLKAQHASSR